MNKFKLLCAAAAFVAPTAVYAQETTSTIRGSVTSAGAPVANAQVTVTHVPTGTVSTVSTNQEGAFAVAGLRLGGPFTVSVATPGFQNFQATDIFLTAGEAFRLPVDLAAEAAGSTDIIVTAASIEGAGNQTLSPTTTLRRGDIEGVASVNRDVRDLIRRSPFAQLDPVNSRAFSIAGQNPRFNRFSVNGVQFTDDFGLNNGGLPTTRGPVPFDAICEFSVEVAPVDIRQGDFQGGAVNAQLCGGTNTPTGGAFYTYSDDSLSGDSIDGQPINLPFTSEIYGAHLRGPLIEDRLFFAFAWERVRQSEPNNFGPTGAGFPNGIPGVTNDTVAQIRGLTQSLYRYDPGSSFTSLPEADDKVTARVDWNINADHALQLVYVYNNGNELSGASGSTSSQTPRFNYFSNTYNVTEEVHSGVIQLNSRWSDMFSTEARVAYRDYLRGQIPPLGREFGQFSVCLAPTGQSSGPLATRCADRTPTLVFGPDQFRQANELNTENLQAQVSANLLVGDHSIQFLAQYTDQDIYNLFVRNASGTFYFDSLEDFRRGNANSLVLRQSTTGDVTGAAAQFNYQTYVVGIQDTWDVTDTLTLVAGVRYEFYDQGIPPARNPFFTSRYGISNQETLNGRDVILPRFGISWTPTERLRLRGSFGRYAAGTPDVWISNSYSNTGVTVNEVSFARTNTGFGCTGVPAGTANGAAICSGALNGVFGAGPGIPGVVRSFIQNDPRSLPLAEVNAIDPEFEIPSQWRAAGTLSYNANLGPLGDNWFFALDGLYGWVEDSMEYIDLRSVRIGTAPDGRPRYGPVAGTFGSSNSDILLTNGDQGQTLILVARFDKEFDNGFSIAASYTYQDVEATQELTSSQATSNYGFQMTADPNRATLGTASDEIDHSVKLNLGYRREFFRDAETRIQLFGEWRRGRPFSYTFDAQQSFAPPNFGRDPVFGTLLSDTRHLIYVPSGPSDPLVVYDSPATATAINNYIDNSVLAGFRGQIAPKNVDRSDDFWKVDLHISQEVPLGERLGRVQLFADMENVLNFINDEWGVLRQVGFNNQTLFNVSCDQVSGSNCTRYRYSGFRTNAPNQNISTGISLWGIRLGARYEF